MTIDICKEEIFPLTAVPERLPQRRGDKKANICTPYRWSSIGCHGEVLETFCAGGTRCTSMEALQRFFDRVTEKKKSDRLSTAATPAALSAAHHRAIDEAERILNVGLSPDPDASKAPQE